MTGWRLVSDVGGTNVRFARASGGGVYAIQAYPTSRFTSFAEAIRAYLDETGGGHGCIGAAIGAAGLVAFGKVSLTNSAWEISEAGVSQELGAPCRLINDVEAVAYQRLGNFGSGLYRRWAFEPGLDRNAPHSGCKYRNRLRGGYAHPRRQHMGFVPKRSGPYVA